MVSGIAITQEGIDVSQASDYQKVLDSRWLFVEENIEIDETIVVPDMGTPTTSGYQRINVARHNSYKNNTKFVPAFHASMLRETPPVAGSDDFYTYTYETGVYADDEWIYVVRRYLQGYVTPSFKLRVKATVYTIPILEDYTAPIEVAPPSFKQDTGIGVRILDGSDAVAKIDGHSSHGFSVDTRKKVLSVHKVVRKQINYDQIYDTARVTAINTTTDILTIAVDPNGQTRPGGTSTGIDWLRTGTRVSYSPADFTTLPAPIAWGDALFVIRLSDTTIQLASSLANAQAGVPINFTSTGSLPGTLRSVGTEDSDRIPHDNEYPPSYMFCEYIANNFGGPGNAVSALYHTSTMPLVMADNTYLYFRGVQAVYAAEICCIILKDPIEVAS